MKVDDYIATGPDSGSDTMLVSDKTLNDSGDYAKSNHTFGGGPNGNSIGFNDGHVEWREYNDSEKRFKLVFDFWY